MFNFDITWILTALSLSGSIFNVKKKVVCFYIWSVCEIFWLILDIRSRTFGRAFLDLTQFGFALYGIHEWGEKNGKKVNFK